MRSSWVGWERGEGGDGLFISVDKKKKKRVGVVVVMASIPCTTTSQLHGSWNQQPKMTSLFLGKRNQVAWVRPRRIRASSKVTRVNAWFKFGKNGVDAEGAGIYGSQSRDDFDRDDVEQYFNYMGMLAVEGTYDKMEALLTQNIHPVDILLMLAASEGDKPKLEELLRAGANYDVKDVDGRTALDRATDQEVKDFILSFSTQKA